MASIEARPRADGGTNYRVRWVLGGGRRGDAPGALETFSDRARAHSFKLLVEASGGQWPAGWVKGSGRDANVPPAQARTARGHRGDWRGATSPGTTCQLCGLVMPTGQWGFADGPLCRPDNVARQDCYRLWVVQGVRPDPHRPDRRRPSGRPAGTIPS